MASPVPDKFLAEGVLRFEAPAAPAAAKQFADAFSGVIPEHRRNRVEAYLKSIQLELEAEGRLRLTVSKLLATHPIPFVLEIDHKFPYAAAWAVSTDLNEMGPYRCGNNATTCELTFFDDVTVFPVKKSFRVDRTGKLAAGSP